MKSIKNSLIYVLLYLLPKNALSLLMGRVASCRWPRPFARALVRAFARAFKIDVDEAELPIEQYACLQDFFARRLKEGARPLPALGGSIISPCDGTMSVTGPISDGHLFQAKGKTYSLFDLMGSDGFPDRFVGGFYATIYLSPRDYHRFHAPVDGQIIKTIHIPGSLWPVNRWAVQNIHNLFCQNERIITIIKERTSNLLLAHIAVGATNVGKIDLAYCDVSALLGHRSKSITVVPHCATPIDRGAPLGKFMFGSTIILLCEPGLIKSVTKKAPSFVKMGEVVAQVA